MVKDVFEWGVLEWSALLRRKEFIDDDYGVRVVVADVLFFFFYELYTKTTFTSTSTSN